MSQATQPGRIVYTADLERARARLKERSVRASIEGLTRAPIEACADDGTTGVACAYHPFIAGLHHAFMDHRPLVLSPDMVWLLIAQGFARILNDDPEAMRAWFVRHTGQLELRVQRDEFIAGSPDNDWPGVFEEFSSLIHTHIGADNHDALVTSFSTTGAVEKAANEVVLLDAMQNYFTYTVMTSCGIPEIRLEGTARDWAHLAERAENLGRRYECDWWIRHVTPWLERIRASAAGADDPDLWQSIYKWKSWSGDECAGGWIVQFFPFVHPPRLLPFGQASEQLVRNRLLGADPSKVGLTTPEWPGALSVAPFRWQYLGRELDMQFLAGFTHCTQDPTTLAIRPAIGWAVRPA